jgi:hypothetical protein
MESAHVVWLTSSAAIGFTRSGERNMFPLGAQGLPTRSWATPHAKTLELTTCKEFPEHFSDPAVQLAGALKMNRTKRLELERKLGQAYRLALEPSDPLTRERLAQLIEELEFQLQDQRKVA